MSERIKEIEMELSKTEQILPHKGIKPVRYYIVFGILWIFTSDRVLSFLIGEYADYQMVQTFKGIFFILATAMILRVFIKKDYLNFEALNKQIFNRNQQLVTINEELVAMEEELNQKITALYDTTDALTEQRKYVYEIYNSSNALIMVWNLKGEVIDINSKFEESLGYALDEIYGKKWIDFLIPESAEPIIKDMIERLKVNYHVENVENKVIKKNGEEIDVLWNDSLIENPITGEANVVSFGVDITKQRLSERNLLKLAYTDALTGLHNRVVYEAKLEQLIRETTPFTIYYIDIDDFKNLNDIHGHQKGNQFLKQYAEQLEIAFPKLEIFRWCEDEFLLVERNATVVHRDVTLSAIKRLTNRKWQLDQLSYVPSISIGTTTYPDDGDDVETLLMTVDMALYKAKTLGKSQVVNYKASLQKEVESYIHIENKIIEAIRENTLKLFHQPIYDMKSKSVVSIEILLRWQDNPLNISTQDFINVAEKTGHIIEIDEWVIENVFKFIQSHHETLNPYVFSINLSVQTFKSDKLLPFLEKVTEKYSIRPNQIEFEITEYSLIDDFDKAKTSVLKLKDMGFKISLDDFGTRFSSLNYLVKMPFDTLKIDKSYVDNILVDTSHAVVVENIIRMSNALGLKTVAEGIEDPIQFKKLANIGCDLGQGYLMSKPEHIEKFLRSSKNFQTESI